MRMFLDRWLTARQRHQVLGDGEDFLLITWDSCRFDAYRDADTTPLVPYGEALPGYAMATYTLPAHLSMFQGFLPHCHEARPFYNRFCQQLWRISHRHVENTPLVTFPERTRNIVWGLRKRGYYTCGVGAMVFFRDAEVLKDGFKDFYYTGTFARKQNEILMEQMDRRAKRRSCFAFVNYGETHSPFRHDEMPDEGEDKVAERFKKRRLFNLSGLKLTSWSLDEEAYQRQVACASFLAKKTAQLVDYFKQRGRPTTVVICGDHGECFGENGLYGHAFYHEKVMEVPMLIFRVNAPPHASPMPQINQHRAA
jgi:sulfatase-like protein